MSKSIQMKTHNNEKVYPHPYYPIGSIYLSVNNTNPSQWFGGTWQLIAQGKTLVGVDPNDSDFNAPEKTGGSKTNSHQHWQTVGCDGSLYISHSHTRSRVIRENRMIAGGTNGNELIRQDSTYEETISIMPPFFTCYIWCRTA